jgi:hypothetical protein
MRRYDTPGIATWAALMTLARGPQGWMSGGVVKLQQAVDLNNR